MNKNKPVRQKRKSIQKIGAAFLAIILVVAMMVGMIPSEVMAATKADLDTSTKYSESLGDNASTEYAGRIWTDKTVWDGESATIQGYNGTEFTVENDSDFLVGFSALATSQAISGQTQAPMDVVFVVDTSGSMMDPMSSTDYTTRIVALVDALNESVDKVMNLNEHTRVAVVAFSEDGQVLLPLGRYEKGTRTYTTGGGKGRPPQTVTVNDYFSVQNSTMYKHVIPEGSTTQETSSRSVTGGTNIQYGYYEGLSVLSNAGTTTATINGTTVNRVPSLIFLSDGAPTFSSSSTSWWAPSENSDDGPGRNPTGNSYYIGNGMKALMTAAYMKVAVNRNYASSLSIYSVGMGISYLTNAEKNLAYVTLAPNDNWNADNDVAEDFRDAWTTYITNDGTPSVNVGGRIGDNYYYDDYYTITHPAQYDIDTDADALQTLVTDYYDADSTSSLLQVFDDIVSNISINAVEVPTEHDALHPMDSGYITYTDPIGEYMEVKDLKSIIYAGKEFTAKSKTTTKTSDTDYTDKYVFEGKVSGNVYGEHNLSEITIEVHTVVVDGIKEQTLTVKIPAGAIPIRVNTVELDKEGNVIKHTNNGTYPVRVLYTVGLQDAVKGDGYIDTEKISAEYLAANTNADGTVNFYSNIYTGTNVVKEKTAGNATVEFEPSHTNPFYYIQENTPIYSSTEFLDENKVSASAALVDNQMYYYPDEHYHGTSKEVTVVERTGAQLKAAGVVNIDGVWNRPVGSPRTNRIWEFNGTKTLNQTNTAEYFYAPTFVQEGATAYDGKFVIYLGNNGVMSAVAGGHLEITKTVTADEGLTAPDKEFEFTVSLKTALGAAVSGEFTYEVIDANDKVISTGTITDGGKLTLKDGQTARVINLPPGTKYTVTETEVAGFLATVSGTDGTIEANSTASAEFKNHYSVESYEYPTEGGLGGTKVLSGRDWEATDKFTFRITSPNGSPLPTTSTVTLENQTAKDGEAVAFDFGKITFTKPGTFNYTIVELTPGMSDADRLAGVSYTREAYEVTITVVDNGNGTLSVTDAKMVKVQNATGEEINEAIDNNVAAFTNTYKTTSVNFGPVAMKDYTDNSGQKPLTDGMFTFQMTPAPLEYNTDVTDLSQVPMPIGTVDGVYTTHNVGRYASFGQIEFTAEHKGNTYYYVLSEVKGNVTGMTYDTAKTIVKVEVTNENVNNVDVIKVTPTYMDENGKALVDANNNAINNATFTNVYTPTPVEVALNGTKTMVGRDMLDGEQFTFAWDYSENAAVDTSKLNATPTAEDGKDGEAVDLALGSVVISKPGTYTFNISEVIPTEKRGGVTYDEVTRIITIVVTDNNGVLEATEPAEVAFVNTYDAADADAISVPARKTLTGKALEAGVFFFEVTPLDGAPMGARTSVVSADAEGAIQLLSNVVYTEAGTYRYVVKEQIPSGAVNNKLNGITYDTTLYEILVTVTDDLNGKLHATYELKEIIAVVDGDGNVVYSAVENVTEIVFENTYTTTNTPVTPYEMTKILSGNRMEGEEAKPLQGGEFTFRKTIVSGPDKGATFGTYPEIITETTITNEADGSVQFGDITFIKPGTYVVKIEEVIPATANRVPGVTYDTHSIQSTFVVTDDGRGNLLVVRTSTTGSREFVNEYNTTGSLDGAKNLNVTKVFTGRTPQGWLDTDSFTFVLEANNSVTKTAIENGDIVLPTNAEGITITGKEVADGETTFSKAFGDIVFNVSGEYQFVIREVAGDIPGVVYDATTRVIHVKAVDNGDGTLTVTIPEEAEKNPTFTNVYDTTSVQLPGHGNLHVSKVLTGREWKSGESYEFTIAPYSDNAKDTANVEMPSVTTLTVTEDNKDVAHFGNITFNTPGDYVFVVTETVPEGAVNNVYNGVTYDAEPRYVNVTVKDADDGTLVVSVTNLSADGYLTFTNKYDVEEVVLPGETNLDVTKVITGRNWTDADAFTFLLKAGDAATQTAIDNKVVVLGSDEVTLKKTDNGIGYFGDITFYEEGTYIFQINEQIPAEKAENMVYDEHIAVVTVVVEDNLNGKLEVTSVSKDASKMTWTNIYTPNPAQVTFEALKSIEGRDWLDTDSFNFLISAVAGTPMPKETMVATDANHKVVFGPITYTAEGSYTYYINEIGTYAGITSDSRTLVVKVDVENNMEGDYVATVVYEGVTDNTFVNTYTTTGDLDGLKVTKNFTGRPNNAWLGTDSFTFTLEADLTHAETKAAVEANHILMPESTLTVDAANKDNAHFGDITFTKGGKYQFIVTEVAPADATVNKDGTYTKDGITYDVTPRTIIVNVVDNLDGTITATLDAGSDSLIFDNTYTTVMDVKNYVSISAEKELVNGSLTSDQFTFVVRDDSNNVVATVKNTTAGAITILQNKEYKEAGTYVYYVNEEIPSDAEYIKGLGKVKDSVIYDETVYRVTFEIVDDKKGNLVLSDKGIQLAIVEKVDNAYEFVQDVAYENFVFTNTEIQYGDLILEKDVKHPYGTEYVMPDMSFTMEVTLVDARGNKVANETFNTVKGNTTGAVTTDADGKFQITLKDGEQIAIVDIEEGVVATVNEINIPTGFEATYHPTNKVTIPADGTAQVVVTNTLQTDDDGVNVKLNISGKKHYKDGFGENANDMVWEDEVFTFIIQRYDSEKGVWVDTESVDTATKTEQDVDFVSDGRVINFKEIGVYSYQVVEKYHGMTIDGIYYDDVMHTLDIIVTDKNMDGVLEAEVKSSHGGENGFKYDEETDTWVNNKVDFTNVNNQKATSVSAMIRKLVENPSGSALAKLEGFQFEIYKTDANYENGELVYTTVATDGAGETYFTLRYEYKGTGEETYYYVLKEKASNISGMIDSTATYKFSVKATYDNDGNASSTLTWADPNQAGLTLGGYKENDGTYDLVTFTNKYVPNPVSFSISLEKELTGREWQSFDEYSFELCEVTGFENGVPTIGDKIATATSSSKVATFKDVVTYDKVGTYYYQLKEAKGTLGGVDYDESVYYIRVTVTDNKGRLEATSLVLNDADNHIVFNNTYSAKDVTVYLKANKDLSGRTLENEEFGFTLVQVDADDKVVSGGVQEAVRNEKDGAINFAGITLKKVGTYYYMVGEMQGSEGGMIYDTTFFRYVVKVTDNQKGNLVASVTLEEMKDGDWAPVSGTEPTFTNVYHEPALEIHKSQAFVGSEDYTTEPLKVEGGNRVTYLLEVKNTVALSVAENLTITDDISGLLEAGFELVDAGGATNTNGILTWNIARLDGEKSVKVRFTVEVPNKVGKWTNVATLVDDDGHKDDSEIVEIYNDEQPNLVIHKVQAVNNGRPTIQKSTVTPGDEITYTIQVSNLAKAAEATKLTVTDDINTLLAGGFVLTSEDVKVEKGIITWEIASLPAGATKEFSFTVVAPEITDWAENETARTWKNVAMVNEDTSEEVEIVENEPNLTIHKAQSLDGSAFTRQTLKVEDGKVVTYRIRVTNTVADSAALDLVVTDDISALLKDGFVVENLGGATEKDGVLTWTIDRLDGEETAEFTFSVIAPNKVGEWKNIAIVTDNGEDTTSEEVIVENDEQPVVDIEKLQTVGGETGDKLIVEPNEEVTYTLVVTNSAKAAPATNVVVTDDIRALLNDNFKYDGTWSSDAENVVFANTDGVFTWTIPVIEAGKSATVSFTVVVPEVKEDTTWKNVAAVGDKEDEVEITEYAPELTILKEQRLDGEEFSQDIRKVEDGVKVYYRITVTNTKADSVATDLVVTDNVKEFIDDGFKIEGATPDENGIITWTIDRLEAGEANAAVFEFAVIAPNKVGEWKNIASVTDNDETKEDEVIVENDEPSDLEIIKEQAIGSETGKALVIEPNEEITYTLIVKNKAKAAPATDVTITDDISKLLNDGFTLVKSADDVKPDDNGVLTWTIDEILAGKEVKVKFTLKAPVVDVDKTWANVAMVTSKDDTDKTDEEVEVTEYAPNLDIIKEQSTDGVNFTQSDEPMKVLYGTEVTYRLTVTNTVKDSVALNVKIADDISKLLADGFTLVSDDVTPDENGVLTWTFDKLAGEDSVVVTFTVKVPNKVGVWRNEATVDADNDTPDDSNEVVITNGDVPVLNIEKVYSVNDGEFTTDITKVKPGDLVTYILQVSNKAEAAVAEKVTITDDISAFLADEFKLVSEDVEADENGILTWTIDTLGVDEVVELKFTLEVPKKVGEWKNIATVDAENGDPDDSDEVIIENNEVADLVIEKLQALNGGEATTELLTVEEGDEVTYILRITNNAVAAIANNVVVTDDISALLAHGFTLVDAEADENGILTWTIDEIAAGETVDVSFTVVVADVAEYTTWENVATITYEVPDNETEDPDDTIPKEDESEKVEIEEGAPNITVSKNQSVNLGKSDEEAKEAKAGDVVIYTIIVTNDGTEAAKGITITDRIPEGLKLVKGILTDKAAISNGGVEANGIITWTIEELAIGETVEVRFAVKVPEVTEDTEWNNIAVVTYDNNFDNPDDGEEEIPTNEVTITGEEVPPKMGDSNMTSLWMALAVASLATCAAVVLQKRKREEA